MPLTDLFPVPAYIKACATAVAYDLNHGPAWVIVPEEGISSFTADHLATFPEDLEGLDGRLCSVTDGLVADTLQAFINDLPATVWREVWADYYCTTEPEGYEDDETGEWIEPEWQDYQQIDRQGITLALFGKTIAHHFH